MRLIHTLPEIWQSHVERQVGCGMNPGGSDELQLQKSTDDGENQQPEFTAAFGPIFFVLYDICWSLAGQD